jgi:hypothetical protein
MFGNVISASLQLYVEFVPMKYQGLQNTHLYAGILRAVTLFTIFLGALGISSQMVIGQTATSAITGRWDTMPYKMPINPIHVGLMHTG